MIYLDSAATAYHRPPQVADAVADAIRHLGNGGRGAHEIALSTDRMLFETRQQLSDLFGADGAEQVAFTANATAGLNMAIQGLFVPGDHVITTAAEHNSVLRPLYHMERMGVKLSILPADRQGRLCLDELDWLVRPETKALVCTHASNVTGNLNDLKFLGEWCEGRGILLVVDASQTAGVFPVHMEQMGISVLCFTGHKSLLGPQGTGGICVRRGLFVASLLMGGSGVQSYEREHPRQMPTALEAGTVNSHGINGLHAALSYIREQGMDTLRGKELERMWQFYDGVSAEQSVTVYGDFSDRDRLRAPIVSLNIGSYDSGEVSDILAVDYGIATRPGAHCAPLIHEALGTRERGAVRFSFSHFNTEKEVETAVLAVRELAREGEQAR